MPVPVFERPAMAGANNSESASYYCVNQSCRSVTVFRVNNGKMCELPFPYSINNATRSHFVLCREHCQTMEKSSLLLILFDWNLKPLTNLPRYTGYIAKTKSKLSYSTAWISALFPVHSFMLNFVDKHKYNFKSKQKEMQTVVCGWQRQFVPCSTVGLPKIQRL